MVAVAFPRYTGRARTLVRALWVVVLALVLGMTVIAVPATWNALHTICPDVSCEGQGLLTAHEVAQMESLGIAHSTFVAYLLITDLLPPLFSYAVALILFARKPDDGMAVFTSFALLLFGGVTYPDFMQVLAGTGWFWAVSYLALAYAGSVCLVALLFTFPTGVVVPRWLRVVLALWMVEEVFAYLSGPPLDLHLTPEWLPNGAFVAILLVAVYAQVHRFRHVSSPQQRRQTKWVVYGTSVALTSLFVAASLFFMNIVDRENPIAILATNAVVVASITMIPVSFGIAILRSRLYDIDILINRTLVYGTVTAILTGVLAMSSDITKRVFLGLTGESSDVAPIVATLIVVAAFDPVKRRVQNEVDKHVKYPSRSFGDFGAKVREHLRITDPSELITTFLDEAVGRFDATSGVAYLGSGPTAVRVALVGDADALTSVDTPASGARVALGVGGRELGWIRLGGRRDGSPYLADDIESLHEMAGLVARVIDASSGGRLAASSSGS